MKFLDQARIYIRSGDGGAGATSFRRAKFVEFGGPDGGNGGRGGDVWILAESNLNTLIDYRYRQHFRAGNGRPGMGANRTGQRGKDILLSVPVGCAVYREEDEVHICDLTEGGQRFLLAQGGKGGFGNQHFKGPENRAPRRANRGLSGKEITLSLRLSLIADSGLIGLPNAGKSSFLATATAARPKIADYPFTTLYPVLGVFRWGGRECILADIPGLIEGAHQGAGLGIRFLGHVKRTRVLVHFVSSQHEDPASAYQIVRSELAAYGNALTEKPEIVVLSQSDLLSLKEQQTKQRKLEKACGSDCILLSSFSGEGVSDLLAAIMQEIL